MEYLQQRLQLTVKDLENYVKENNIPKSYKIFKINGSNLVDLVESGKFLNNKKYCKKIIKKSLDDYIITEKIDTLHYQVLIYYF